MREQGGQNQVFCLPLADGVVSKVLKISQQTASACKPHRECIKSQIEHPPGNNW